MLDRLHAFLSELLLKTGVLDVFAFRGLRKAIIEKEDLRFYVKATIKQDEFQSTAKQNVEEMLQDKLYFLCEERRKNQVESFRKKYVETLVLKGFAFFCLFMLPVCVIVMNSIEDERSIFYALALFGGAALLIFAFTFISLLKKGNGVKSDQRKAVIELICQHAELSQSIIEKYCDDLASVSVQEYLKNEISDVQVLKKLQNDPTAKHLNDFLSQSVESTLEDSKKAIRSALSEDPFTAMIRAFNEFKGQINLGYSTPKSSERSYIDSLEENRAKIRQGQADRTAHTAGMHQCSKCANRSSCPSSSRHQNRGTCGAFRPR